MPQESPFVVRLDAGTRIELERRAAKYTLPYFMVVRARLVLMAADGYSNKEIALRLSMRRETVSEWRKRFRDQALEALDDRPRRGRPRNEPRR